MAVPAAGRQFVKHLADASTTTLEGGGSGVVASFSFTPDVSTRYYVEGVMLLRSSAAGTGPRVGIQWPTVGIVDEICHLYGSGLLNGPTVHHCEGVLDVVNRTCLLTAVSSTAFSYPVILRAEFETGPVITGDFQILLFSETGSSVTLKAGSFLAVYSGHVNQ
jgi:hypothetical protein